jgi:hypothetical protein
MASVQPKSNQLNGVVPVPYLSFPGEEFEAPLQHCRLCHHTAIPRTNKAPLQCSNRNGYRDSNDKWHEACGTTLWHKWPPNFKPEETTCVHCLAIWAMEKHKGVAAVINNPETPRRGRPRAKRD